MKPFTPPSGPPGRRSRPWLLRSLVVAIAAGVVVACVAVWSFAIGLAVGLAN